MILLITWVSTSWKTTLKEELVSRGWKSAINFTTREPRSDKEKDDYVFISKELFKNKADSWHFLEQTETYWTNYAVSKYLPEWNVVIVVDPVGREQIMEKLSREWVAFATVYLDITRAEQAKRLEVRWASINDINSREKDFQWFSETRFCIKIDGTKEVFDIANLVERNILD